MVAHCKWLETLFVVVAIGGPYQRRRRPAAEIGRTAEKLEAVASHELDTTGVAVAAAVLDLSTALIVRAVIDVTAAGIAVEVTNVVSPVLAAIDGGSFAENGKLVDQCYTSHC
jgi:hypothetical protein